LVVSAVFRPAKSRAAGAEASDRATDPPLPLDTPFTNLLPDLMGRLQPRFEALRPGTRVVSHAFRMAGWRPDRSETMRIARAHAGQGDQSTLYLWIIPADVRGTWSGGGRRVRIEQSYQDIDVEGATQAKLSGSDVSWQTPQGTFRGRVEGNRIVGELGGQAVVLTR
jgi:hypothetical protein